MISLLLQIKGRPPRPLGPQAPILLVGRAPDNDWVIEDPSISRIHAQFQWQPNGVTLKDLGSRNGTSLNGIMIRDEVAVKPGDKVMLGSVPLSVAAQGQASVLIDSDEAATSITNASIIMPAASSMPSRRSRARSGPQVPFQHLARSTGAFRSPLASGSTMSR